MLDNTNYKNEIDERDIHRSKCILNAAIPASLNGKHPNDIRAVKAVVFEILDSEDPIYEGVKGVLIEGDLFDAAQMLEFAARRMPDRAGVLFIQAAVLFAPLMNVKSIMAFEQAQNFDVDMGPYHEIMARLFERMGNSKSSQQQRKMAEAYIKTHSGASEVVADDGKLKDLPDNVTYLSFRP